MSRLFSRAALGYEIEADETNVGQVRSGKTVIARLLTENRQNIRVEGMLLNISPLIGVIDDDEDVRLSLEDLLLSLGYRAEAFPSADDFVNRGSPHPDCIISDVQMPGMSGIELARHVRQVDPALPIILITAFPSEDISRQATDAGATSFLRKPFDPNKLLACLESALGV